MTSLINNLGGTIGFGEFSLTRNDDSFENGVSLTSVFGSAGLNFFGTNYTYAAINNNGNITLSNSSFGGLSTYTPFGLANGGYAIIAPFFADVDTRLTDGTAAANQVTPTPGGTSRGSDLVWYDLDTAGFGTLTVTWDDVGYFSRKIDKLNAFQLQVVGQGGNGNFDIIFRYENISWTTGDVSGGTDGLGGIVARAGYSTGDGASWYELSQSGMQDAMLALESTAGNTGVSGYYKFSVRNGTDAPETLNGTSSDDLLAGAGGNDTLNGFAGNDYLTGNAGADRLVGGTGNDTYTIDEFDTIVELANEGIDSVLANVAYTLGANLENLRLTGSSAINGTGNAADNILAGNTANNTLNGMGGNDTVDYSLATSGITVSLSSVLPQFVPGQGTDTLNGIENILGSIYDDTLTGTAGANILNGNLGADTMTGGDGADTYYVDNAGDSATETNADAGIGGIDTVYSSLSGYSLGANVENGRIITAGAANLTGNSLNNLIYAGAGDNQIDGGAGIDAVSYLYAETAGTMGITVDLAAVNGLGQVSVSGISGTDLLKNIENIKGSNYADVIKGNSETNVLKGGAGNDKVKGGGGNDFLKGGAGNDLIIGSLGNDTLTGGAGSDVFRFNKALDSINNKDTIVDFNVADDTIQLENAIFTKLLNPGTTLAAGNFRASTTGAAADADDYVLYNTVSGVLSYDADGNGAGVAVDIALVGTSSHPALTAADFVVF